MRPPSSVGVLPTPTACFGTQLHVSEPSGSNNASCALYSSHGGNAPAADSSLRDAAQATPPPPLLMLIGSGNRVVLAPVPPPPAAPIMPPMGVQQGDPATNYIYYPRALTADLPPPAVGGARPNQPRPIVAEPPPLAFEAGSTAAADDSGYYYRPATEEGAPFGQPPHPFAFDSARPLVGDDVRALPVSALQPTFFKQPSANVGSHHHAVEGWPMAPHGPSWGTPLLGQNASSAVPPAAYVIGPPPNLVPFPAAPLPVANPRHIAPAAVVWQPRATPPHERETTQQGPLEYSWANHLPSASSRNAGSTAASNHRGTSQPSLLGSSRGPTATDSSSAASSSHPTPFVGVVSSPQLMGRACNTPQHSRIRPSNKVVPVSMSRSSSSTAIIAQTHSCLEDSLNTAHYDATAAGPAGRHQYGASPSAPHEWITPSHSPTNADLSLPPVGKPLFVAPTPVPAFSASPERAAMDGRSLVDALRRERTDDIAAQRVHSLPEQELELVAATLEASPQAVFDLCVHDRGRVIASVLGRRGAHACAIAFAVVCSRFEEITTTKFGCIAIQRIAKELSDVADLERLFSYCLPLAPQLIAHPYGNFVVSHFMSCGCDSFVAQLCAKVSEDPSNVHRAAVDRYGSYALETILKNGSAAALRPLFNALFLHSDQSLLDLCSHERGSYAIESAINAMQLSDSASKVGLPARGDPASSQRSWRATSAVLSQFGKYVEAANRVLPAARFAQYIDRRIQKLVMGDSA